MAGIGGILYARDVVVQRAALRGFAARLETNNGELHGLAKESHHKMRKKDEVRQKTNKNNIRKYILYY